MMKSTCYAHAYWGATLFSDHLQTAIWIKKYMPDRFQAFPGVKNTVKNSKMKVSVGKMGSKFICIFPYVMVQTIVDIYSNRVTQNEIPYTRRGIKITRGATRNSKMRKNFPDKPT